MNTEKNIRPILIILLIISSLVGLVLLGAGSHGISMKNKETALMVYGALVFILTAIVNGISMREKCLKIIGILSFILNFVSGLILTYYLFFSIQFNINGGHIPVFFIAVIGIEILMIGRIITTDIKEMRVK